MKRRRLPLYKEDTETATPCRDNGVASGSRLRSSIPPGSSRKEEQGAVQRLSINTSFQPTHGASSDLTIVSSNGVVKKSVATGSPIGSIGSQSTGSVSFNQEFLEGPSLSLVESPSSVDRPAGTLWQIYEGVTAVARGRIGMINGTGKKREAEKLIDSLTPTPKSISPSRSRGILTHYGALFAIMKKDDILSGAGITRHRRKGIESLVKNNIESEDQSNGGVAVFDGSVILRVDGKIYSPIADESVVDDETNLNAIGSSRQLLQRHALGHDGNQYYCEICKEFGNIVCCDGCPKVYHPSCLPTSTPSQQDLENDVDPWFCPSCWPSMSGDGDSSQKRIRCLSGSTSKRKSTPMQPNEAMLKRNSGPHMASKTDIAKAKAIDHLRLSSLQKCVDCQKMRSDRRVKPCYECGNHVHFPYCLPTGGVATSTKLIYCSTCRAMDVQSQDEKAGCVESIPRLNSSSLGPRTVLQAEIDDNRLLVGTIDGTVVTRPKRKYSSGMTSVIQEEGVDKKSKVTKAAALINDFDSMNKHRHVGSTKQQLSTALSSKQDFEVVGRSREYVGTDYTAIVFPRRDLSQPKATPAFYFYLAENRWKIERLLSRKHRLFGRMPKGLERCELVSREAALWWVKLRSSDQRRYMNMSMRDFENQVLQWKEDQAIHEHEMKWNGTEDDDLEMVASRHDLQSSIDEERYSAEGRKRLSVSTVVGCKTFKPEPGEKYNRVLLEVLHDLRFHPVPIFNVQSSDIETDELNVRTTVPYYEIHGPVSSCLGDECLGCTRGWNHFCPVLQRRIPFIEHRAKLQPPLSSLLNTRVGLGLRPMRFKYVEEKDSDNHIREDLFVPRDNEERKALLKLSVLPSTTLAEPSARADDVVHFIEQLVAMKVPQSALPAAPSIACPSSAGMKKQGIRILPVMNQVADAGEENEENCMLNKCGRCRTIIVDASGCVQCRQAQLVLSFSRQLRTGVSSSHQQSLLTNVSTTMLGRVHCRDGYGDSQSLGDQAFSTAIMKMRWTPYAILPPVRSLAPLAHCEQNDSRALTGEVESSRAACRTNSSKALIDDDEYDESSVVSYHEKAGESGLQDSIIDEILVNAVALRENDQPHPGSTVLNEEANANHHDRMTNFQRKATSIACMSMLLALLRRDPLQLFRDPVKAENYSFFVATPISFGKIKSSVLSRGYATIEEFVLDVRLLCDNALAYNPLSSIYSKTAAELQALLGQLHHRTIIWMTLVEKAFSQFLISFNPIGRNACLSDSSPHSKLFDGTNVDPFRSLRKTWPDAVDLLESEDQLRKELDIDFNRTMENELAFYGGLVIRRAAAAAESSLAPYSDSMGPYGVVPKRDHVADENLRRTIDCQVAQLDHSLQLKDVTSWREEGIVRFVRKVQSRRLEKRLVSGSGCSKCNPIIDHQEAEVAMDPGSFHYGKSRRRSELDVHRVDVSRGQLTTGLASAKALREIEENKDGIRKRPYSNLNNVKVSVRGSKIHGWGLFADQPFKKGDAVAEYLGEYISNCEADVREKQYRMRRIQDYQFRLDSQFVIDATMKGGYGRYINHNCSPTCCAKIIPSSNDSPEMMRVIIVALRDIKINDEVTYDYQFPLELNLAARIPCNCQSEICRGFMNWDIPEKGTNNRSLFALKRSTNVKDRIRRLGRPLKREEN